MKRFLCVLLMVASLVAKADEGMWVVGDISAKTNSLLKSLGLELTPEELYRVDGPSLNSAIVMFGGFCSGVVVSQDGLVFTNHHCGFGSIQEHSTLKNDYLKNGFVAKSYKDELPNEGLYVAFHLKTIDVTERVNEGITSNMPLMEKKQRQQMNALAIEEAVQDTVMKIYGEVSPFYKGSKYYLSVYQRYDDVRLVFAPPQSLGKFGGDLDNWMWPRQTCDFSVFRIYADKDNKPADYNKDNVPFHATSYAHVSTQGYQPGSYCMTLGYPGSTDRYLSSFGIDNTMRTTNDLRYEVRTVKLDILREAMQKDDDIRIKYASKFASSSNYWKFSLGQNKALKDLDVIREKQELEAEIDRWARQNQKSEYIGILDSLKQLYDANFMNSYERTLLIESFYSGNDILNAAIAGLTGAVTEKSGKDELQKLANETYKDIDIDLDKRVFAALIKNYMKMTKVKNTNLVFIDKIKEDFGGDVDKYVDNLYATSILTDRERVLKIESFSEIYSDPMFDIATDVLSGIMGCTINRNVDTFERLLGDALREMNKNKEYYPDANFTMRLSAGIVEGYSPSADLSYVHYTLPQSLIDKYEQNPNEYDYELIPSVYKWMKKGKFGKRYIDKDLGEMPLCFLTNNDITGGNSGSGMFDSKGRLIGLAFDGNWEAMSGDLKFDNKLQRTIGVDIRYVLSVIETYGKGKRLIKELTLE